MKKDSVICFRVSKELHESLARVAKSDRRSLSSMIEMILNGYLNEKNAFPGVEMRRYSRKPVAIPAVIRQEDCAQSGQGSIVDISLGGAGILIPKNFAQNIAVNSKGAKFDIIFDLPQERQPVRMTCKSARVAEDEDGIIIGAVFVDAEFNSYQILQTYLM